MIRGEISARIGAKDPGGQAHDSSLAIETASTLRAMFKLALRRGEGPIGAIMRMPAIGLAVPEHSTLSRRAWGPPVQSRPRSKTSERHLIVDRTGLNIGIAADRDEIVALNLTEKEVHDASHGGPLPEQVADAPASFMGDGAYDRAHVLDTVLAKNPTVGFIISPPAVPVVITSLGRISWMI